MINCGYLFAEPPRGKPHVMEKRARKENTLPADRRRSRLVDILIVVFCAGWLAAGVAMQFSFDPFERGKVIEKMGDYTQFAVPAAGVVGAFVTRDMQGLGQFALGCLSNLGITTGLKYGINRTRPNGEPYSFPSGHTSFAFQGAVFIQRRYGWKLGLLALLAASFVGFSRVESDWHFVSDVMAGAAIGAACSYAFTRPRPKTDAGDGNGEVPQS